MVNHTEGPMPMSALGHGLDLHLGNLGPTAYGGRALRNAHGGLRPRIHLRRGLGPSHTTGHIQAFHPKNQTAMAHGDLTQGMARGGHIIFENHGIVQTNGATPIIRPYPIQTRRMAKLDLMIETRLEQCPR